MINIYIHECCQIWRDSGFLPLWHQATVWTKADVNIPWNSIEWKLSQNLDVIIQENVLMITTYDVSILVWWEMMWIRAKICLCCLRCVCSAWWLGPLVCLWLGEECDVCVALVDCTHMPSCMLVALVASVGVWRCCWLLQLLALLPAMCAHDPSVPAQSSSNGKNLRFPMALSG